MQYCTLRKNPNTKNLGKNGSFGKYQDKSKVILRFLLCFMLKNQCKCFRIEGTFSNEWYSTKTRPNISNYDLELNFIQKELISRCSEANKKEEINCNKKRIFSEIKDNQSDYTFQHRNISKSDKNVEWITKNEKSIVFDYSDEFIIRSKYLNNLPKSEQNVCKCNISEITKTNIDIETFEIFLFVLHFGYNIKCLDLKKEKFMDFLVIFSDLICYAESNVIFGLYKHLISLLVSYKNDILNKFPNEIEKHIFSVNTSPFLPFLSTFFDDINVEFDENINEVLFLKNTNENEIYYFHKTIINDIKIRTTPKALILIENQADFDAELFFWVIFSYKINGLKISHDNMYYSECYEKDKDYIENNLPRESLTPKLFLFSSKVLKAIIIMKKTQIRYLELERVTLTPYDICIMQNLNNLESLILVNCILPLKISFFLNCVGISYNLKF
ncbi:hypothetical protein CWI38_0632p0030 [Hamiltosporidium tvaerminnensis]|uniref:Uncharacterized protein n=1 Tax=Hamiltosporidium tvaerminnensis TaxID=1176355 RepID=A0A4Q9LXZ6_9MICR|nr:hypothetical protein CWI38_0632p0030 [Hamiltosporidium tvaerminnensis]